MPVESHRLPLGSRVPWFEVVDLEGTTWTPEHLPLGAPILVAFLCNHSPYVVHIERSLGALAEEIRALGVVVLGIAPNDERAYPADCRNELATQARRARWQFPYGFDETQRAAKAFGAMCTPEFFVYDRDWKLAYHGQYDSSRPASADAIPVTGGDLLTAVEATIHGRPVRRRQVPAFGCSIKWRAGSEPAYMFTG